MWEIYVVFVDRTGYAESLGYAGGINIVADSLAALVNLVNRYKQENCKILAYQRLRHNGRIHDIRYFMSLPSISA